MLKGQKKWFEKNVGVKGERGTQLPADDIDKTVLKSQENQAELCMESLLPIGERGEGMLGNRKMCGGHWPHLYI